MNGLGARFSAGKVSEGFNAMVKAR